MRADVCFLAALLAASLACGRAAAPTPAEAARYGTGSAELAPVEIRAPFLGTVVFAREVQLKAQAAGRVTAIEIPDGGDAAAGAVVLRLGGVRYETAQRATVAAMAAAEETVAARSSQLERARRRAAESLAGPSELAEARVALAAAERARAEAEARADALRAAGEVRAPFAGVLLERQVAVGQEVAAGEVLASLADPGSVRVEGTVMTVPGRTIEVGQNALVTTPSGGTTEAQVAGVEATASAAGRLRIWLAGDGVSSLQAGAAVSGWVVVDRHQGVVVPSSAVVRDDDDRPWVFVGAAAPFERRAVTLGISRDDRVELLSGLSAGETVVVDGAYQLLWSGFDQTYTVAD